MMIYVFDILLRIISIMLIYQYILTVRIDRFSSTIVFVVGRARQTIMVLHWYFHHVLPILKQTDCQALRIRALIYYPKSAKKMIEKPMRNSGKRTNNNHIIYNKQGVPKKERHLNIHIKFERIHIFSQKFCWIESTIFVIKCQKFTFIVQ